VEELGGVEKRMLWVIMRRGSRGDWEGEWEGSWVIFDVGKERGRDGAVLVSS
jgi:hypothetical protein